MVPAEVYEAARHVWIWGDVPGNERYDRLRAWAALLWLGGHPTDPSALALWVLSQVAQDGHE